MHKRGSVWWMSFVYQGKRYRISIETSDRKRAQKIYDAIKGQIAENRWIERSLGEDNIFTEMMEKYLVEHASQKASARQYKGYVKNLLKFFGDCSIKEITPSLVNQFKIKRRKDGVGPASINRELAILKNAFNIASRQWEWVGDNPVARIPMEKEPPGRVRYLTDKEFEKLLDACVAWLKPIVLVARHGYEKGEYPISDMGSG